MYTVEFYLTHRCDPIRADVDLGVMTMSSALHIPQGYSVTETSSSDYLIFVAAFHQTGLDTRSKARRPIKVGIKGRGRSGTS